MDEKEKEVLKEESGENIAAEETQTAGEASAEKTEDAVKADTEASSQELSAPEAKKRLHKALIRAGAALLAALLLLAVTKFSIVDLLKGAQESDSVQDEEIGTFVKRDVFAILGFFDAKADESTDAGTTEDASISESLTPADSTSGEYALVPMGGKFVTVHFTKRYLDSAYAIEAQTYGYINGSVSTLDSYVKIEGTTETLSEALSTQMYDWFALNKDWMVQAGVIADADDNAAYLSDVVLEVDTVKGMSEGLVYALTGLAAACVLYILAELILMATGFYLRAPKKKSSEEDNAEDTLDVAGTDEASDLEEKASDDETKSSEESVAGEITEETSKNSDVSEAEATEASEIQEEK